MLNPKLTVFFLLGMFLLNLDNTMSYNFDYFLSLLLVFYMFLTVLIFFYNFPFSAKPEYLFSIMKIRFFKHADALFEIENTPAQLGYFKRKMLKYHLFHLLRSVEKLKLWGSKIDMKYFSENKTQEVENFITTCSDFVQAIERKDDETKVQELYKNTQNTAKEINWQDLKRNRF